MYDTGKKTQAVFSSSESSNECVKRANRKRVFDFWHSNYKKNKSRHLMVFGERQGFS